MRHVFFCVRGARGDLGQRACDGQQVLYAMAHLARQQLVGFLSLLALSDIEKDAEHNPISYVALVSLASSVNPSDGDDGRKAKINLVRPSNRPRSRKSGPYPFQIGRV